MIRPWYRSRLFWLGIVLIPLLLAAWWASEFYPSVTILRQNHRHRELGHRFGGWSYFSVDRPSVLLHLQRVIHPGFSWGSIDPPAWEQYIDAYGFHGPTGKPSWSFQLAEEARYLPEESAAQTAYFPPASWQSGAGWRFLFVPYWLLLPGFLAVWATALRVWQKWKRTKCA